MAQKFYILFIGATFLISGLTFCSKAYAESCDDISAISNLMTSHNLTELHGRLSLRDEDTRWYEADYYLPNAVKCEVIVSKPDESISFDQSYQCEWKMPEVEASRAKDVLVKSLVECGLEISRERSGRFSDETVFTNEYEVGGIEHVNRFKVSLRSRVDRRGNQVIKFSASHTDWK